MFGPLISLLRRVSPLAWLPIGLMVFKAAYPAAGSAGAQTQAAPHPLGVRETSLREVSGPPLRAAWRTDAQRQAARTGGAARGLAARAGRTAARSNPSAAAASGQTASFHRHSGGAERGAAGNRLRPGFVEPWIVA